MGSFKQFRQELIKYIREIEWLNPFALTLTLKQRQFNKSLDLIQVTTTIRHFLNRLNRSIFGNASKRYKKSIQFVPIIEYGPDTRYHIHAIIDCPSKLNETILQSKIQSAWIDRTTVTITYISNPSTMTDGPITSPNFLQNLITLYR
ncbi:MAG: hypothetical protein EBU00_12260 [Alphaproteobacteria bacterium]|nr:hypothetical protein [Alphaproteobacteria bacterium]